MVLAGAALAVVAALALGSAVLAQGPAGYGPGGIMMGGMSGAGCGMGMRGGMEPIGPANSLVAVAAEKLGMTQADLVAQLHSGKTIAQIATDKNVALTTIVDAFIAPRKAHLETLVANGQLTQAQMDTMLATMQANVTARLNQPGTPQGCGPGAGFVDANGDGVCDHAGSGRMGNRPGSGPRAGPRGDQGQ
jgi:hypothetical protein